jgi:hypothetical protein
MSHQPDQVPVIETFYRKLLYNKLYNYLSKVLTISNNTIIHSDGVSCWSRVSGTTFFPHFPSENHRFSVDRLWACKGEAPRSWRPIAVYAQRVAQETEALLFPVAGPGRVCLKGARTACSRLQLSTSRRPDRQAWLLR